MHILVVGQSGMLARELLPSLQRAGFTAECRGRPDLDLTQPATLEQALYNTRPDILINAAAYTAVDKAESEPEVAFAVNQKGPGQLAILCRQADIPLIHISTDYVFNGYSSVPYDEADPTAPLGRYGQSKWAGEEAVRTSHDKHFIIRTAWLYASHGANFVNTMLRLGQERDELRVVNDQWGCPTWSRDLADALTHICQSLAQTPVPSVWGTYHYCGADPTTWYEFAQAIFLKAQLAVPLAVQQVIPIPTSEYPTPTPRPANSVLDCSKIQNTFGIIPRPWRASLTDCLQELYPCTTIPRDKS